MDKNKKSMILAIVAVISFIVITVGTTVAFFNYAKNGSTENTLETGSISFIYEEVNKIGNGISIEDALPISDSEGKAQTNYFDFKVTSSTASTIAIPYEITTRVVEGSDDLTDYVKLYLTKVNGNNEEEKVLSIYSDLDDSTNVLASRYNDKTLYESEIPVDVSNFVENYRLRMWIDDSVDYSSGEFNDKTFSIKVNVYANGEQANEQKIVSAGSIGIDSIVADSQIAIEDTNTNNNYDYYLEVQDGVTELDIDINASNPNASVDIEKISGEQATTLKQLSTSKKLTLTSGANYFKITVTSANRKNTEVYVLKVMTASYSPIEDLLTYMTDYTSIDGTNIYRYTGANPNNYATFAGDTAGWRIVGYFNGYLKLVKTTSIGDFKWNDTTGMYANWDEPATLRTEINDSKYSFATDRLVTPYNWCIGTENRSTNTTYARDCATVSTSQVKVGLLSLYDSTQAQWIKAIAGDNYYWTISKDGDCGATYAGKCAIAFSNSGVQGYSSDSLKPTLPAVYLKKGVEFSGEGTIQNPYVFSKNQNTITLDANGGTVSQSTIRINNGSTIGNLPTPTRSNYTFKGWYTGTYDGTRINSTDTLTDDLYLYAHWEWLDNCNTSNVSVEFDYIQGKDILPVGCNGSYKLEVWGASGADSFGDGTDYPGGYGGYSSAVVTLHTGDMLDIVVGGQGGTFNYVAGKAAEVAGGYNGGGAGATNAASNWPYRNLFAGGGATHIAIHDNNYDVLSSYGTAETASNYVYLVAGGGGSGSAQKDKSGNYSYANGGSGGGTKGGDNIMIRRGGAVGSGSRTGGTQSSCGSGNSTAGLCGFGQGYALTPQAGSWGGGGGWYGGNTGAGGSGHINTSLVTTGSMVCYNCMTISDDVTTVNECYNSSAVSNCSKDGNGYAKITYLGN